MDDKDIILQVKITYKNVTKEFKTKEILTYAEIKNQALTLFNIDKKIIDYLKYYYADGDGDLIEVTESTKIIDMVEQISEYLFNLDITIMDALQNSQKINNSQNKIIENVKMDNKNKNNNRQEFEEKIKKIKNLEKQIEDIRKRRQQNKDKFNEALKNMETKHKNDVNILKVKKNFEKDKKSQFIEQIFAERYKNLDNINKVINNIVDNTISEIVNDNKGNK